MKKRFSLCIIALLVASFFGGPFVVALDTVEYIGQEQIIGSDDRTTETSIVSETTTVQEPVTKVTYSSVGGSEYELKTFKEKLVVGEKGQIRRPQNSPLKDSIYSFAMTVSDPSVLSFDEEGNWTAHKAGKTDVTFGFPSGDSVQAKRFNEELTKLNVELEVKDVAVTMTITVVEPESQVMYRLYNPNNKEHFYTANLHEKYWLGLL